MKHLENDTNYILSYNVESLTFDEATLIEKESEIYDNTISFTIAPENTIGKKSGGYEVRIYKEKTIYQVIKGDIGIQSSIRPFLYADEEV